MHPRLRERLASMGVTELRESPSSSTVCPRYTFAFSKR